MKLFCSFFLYCFSGYLLAQGCSDAGFCTMGAMRPNQIYNKKLKLKLRAIEYNFYRGTSTISPIIYAHTIEFNASLGDKISIQAKIPYMHIEGNLGTNSGMGDISLSLSRNLITRPEWSISGTIGGKIPTNQSNHTTSNQNSSGQIVPLPMYYQTSLGSYDVVAGMAWLNTKWLFATGIQIALTENNNQFSWNDWEAYPDQDYLRKNDLARNLQRGTDIMLRAERSFRFPNFDFSIGLLPIYRITPDEIFIPAENRHVKQAGTTGLALSGLTSFGYSININHGLRFIYGFKIIDRPVNPDGLTRHDVISISYIYRF